MSIKHVVAFDDIDSWIRYLTYLFHPPVNIFEGLFFGNNKNIQKIDKNLTAVNCFFYFISVFSNYNKTFYISVLKY